MDMLYYIYIGSNHATIDHLSKVTGGMFMAVSSCNKATKVIDGIRERYNTSILYEQSDPQKDCEFLLVPDRHSSMKSDLPVLLWMKMSYYINLRL